MIVQISAGHGRPPECQLAVGKLFRALQKEYGDLQLISSTKADKKGCFDSIRFHTENDLSGLEGTVLWICKSPYRKNHKRKNWYVDISIIPDVKEIATDHEYRVEKFHCGGKGGTGVRIIHIPTGIISQSTEERSQFQNKQRAIERLQEKLNQLQREQNKEQINTAWEEHNKIVRGNPVRVYEGEKFILKEERKS